MSRLASAKDIKDPVIAARAAAAAWQSRTGSQRCAALLRCWEVFQQRAAALQRELEAAGIAPDHAAKQVKDAAELLLHYAGWPDKLAGVLAGACDAPARLMGVGLAEARGIVAVASPAEPVLLALVHAAAAVLASGNAAIVLAPAAQPAVVSAAASAFAAAELPAGLLRIITGDRAQLLTALASHRDVDALLLADVSEAELASARLVASPGLRCVLHWHTPAFDPASSLSLLRSLVQIKTVWSTAGH